MRAAEAAIVAVIVVSVLSGTAMATAGWQNAFRNLYKPRSGTALARAKCAVCHMRKNGSGGLNPYGNLFREKKAEASSLRAVERRDPDKDSFANIVEIKAGTLPGDPKSKPRKK